MQPINALKQKLHEFWLFVLQIFEMLPSLPNQRSI